MNKNKKILIVGTQPYRKTNQSRALDTYFREFKKENLMQIYSDSLPPEVGHCSSFYQITDKRLLKRKFNKSINVGKLYLDSELNKAKNSFSTSKKKYSPSFKGPIYRFFRKWLWKKKYWDESLLEETVGSFRPDYVFICLSKDFFILDIALHFSEKYSAPIIFCISDDYYFYDEYKFHPFNLLYRKLYKQLFKKCIAKTCLGIFCSNKIKEKYINEFKIKGETIYIASNAIPKKPFNINHTKDWYYFGNLEYGRFKSLKEIASCLCKNKSTIKLHVFSKDLKKMKSNNPNLVLHHSIPYEELIKTMSNAGALIIVEGFGKKNINMVKYSLSTKVGDSLCSGVPVVAYGSNDSGAISFLKEKNVLMSQHLKLN